MAYGKLINHLRNTSQAYRVSQTHATSTGCFLSYCTIRNRPCAELRKPTTLKFGTRIEQVCIFCILPFQGYALCSFFCTRTNAKFAVNGFYCVSMCRNCHEKRVPICGMLPCKRYLMHSILLATVGQQVCISGSHKNH